MKFLLSKALIVAAVGFPSAALSWGHRGQIVLGEDSIEQSLAEQGFSGEEYNEPENEWGLFSEDVWAEESNDEIWGDDGDDYDTMDWNFPSPPKPPSKLPWDGPRHPPSSPFPPPPHDEPPRSGRPGAPGGDHPKGPGKDRRPGQPGCDCSPRFRFPHPPPHRRPGPPPHHPPGPPPHRRFPCPGHGHKPIYTNKTIYELLSESKYTTKAFEIIKNDEELSDFFKNTKSNITLFVPTDKAFEKFPHHGHNSTDAMSKSKEFIRKAVLYHTSTDAYDTKKLVFTKTIPSGLESQVLGKGNNQRLRISFTPIFGLRVNFLSKIVAGNIFATNGIIHGVDNLIFLPPYAEELVTILPSFFSTSALALTKLEASGALKLPEGPKTFFLPVNSSWRRLGTRINGFLFSRFGEKHLAALLKYHIAQGKVVYSDYVIEEKGDKGKATEEVHYHADLDTLLEDKKLTVDIWRKGPWTKWRINGRIPAIVTDIITRDGVLHIPHDVLIPPNPHRSEKPNVDEPFRVLDEEDEAGEEGDGELTFEDLMERLEPYL